VGFGSEWPRSRLLEPPLDPINDCNRGSLGLVEHPPEVSHRRHESGESAICTESASTGGAAGFEHAETFVYHVSGGPRRAARAAGKMRSRLEACRRRKGMVFGIACTSGQFIGQLDRQRFPRGR